MNLYRAFTIDIFKCALQASDLWVRSDISIPVYTRLLLHKLIFVRLSRTTKPPSFYGHRSIQKGSVQCNRQSMLPVPRGPCVRKLFTGLIMYLPSQNKEHCIVLYCTHSICRMVLTKRQEWMPLWLNRFRQIAKTLVFANSSLNLLLYSRKIREVRQSVKDTIRQLFCSSS